LDLFIFIIFFYYYAYKQTKMRTDLTWMMTSLFSTELIYRLN